MFRHRTTHALHYHLVIITHQAQPYKYEFLGKYHEKNNLTAAVFLWYIFQIPTRYMLMKKKAHLLNVFYSYCLYQVQQYSFIISKSERTNGYEYAG